MDVHEALGIRAPERPEWPIEERLFEVEAGPESDPPAGTTRAADEPSPRTAADDE